MTLSGRASAARAPEAPAVAAGLALGGGQVGPVGVVGRDAQGAGVAVGDQGPVHEQPVAGALHVGQQAVVAVADLHVAGEADLGPLREQRLGAGRRLGPEAVDGCSRLHRLGGVDAEQPDRLGAGPEVHLDGVPIDHVGDGARARRWVVATAAPGAGAHGSEAGEQHEEGGPAAGAWRGVGAGRGEHEVTSGRRCRRREPRSGRSRGFDPTIGVRRSAAAPPPVSPGVR